MFMTTDYVEKKKKKFSAHYNKEPVRLNDLKLLF